MSQHDETACKLSAVDEVQRNQAPNGQLVSRKPGGLILVAAAYVLGGGGMLTWLVFVLLGPWILFDVGLGATGRLLLDTLLCLLFFIQHSIMVRRRFRLWLTRRVRADFHGVLYASASGLCLLTLVGLWQPVGAAMWTPASAIRWAMVTAFIAAGAGAWWGTRSLGAFDALGIKTAIHALTNQKPIPATPFLVRGPYRWVRHPLYFFSLVVIWSGPIFTVDRLLHNMLWTVWIAIGATLEERDLVACFGQPYRTYQKTVPMLLPKSVRPLVPDLSEAASNDP
jgi:protein-S-isoprenylcysteine O-methyltransferase Ste14